MITTTYKKPKTLYLVDSKTNNLHSTIHNVSKIQTLNNNEFHLYDSNNIKLKCFLTKNQYSVLNTSKLVSKCNETILLTKIDKDNCKIEYTVRLYDNTLVDNSLYTIFEYKYNSMYSEHWFMKSAIPPHKLLHLLGKYLTEKEQMQFSVNLNKIVHKSDERIIIKEKIIWSEENLEELKNKRITIYSVLQYRKDELNTILSNHLTKEEAEKELERINKRPKGLTISYQIQKQFLFY